jgi:hypothetical protein
MDVRDLRDSDGAMNAKNITDAVSAIVGELAGFSPEERQRIVRASLTLLGDSSENASAKADEDTGDAPFPTKARMWMKRYSVTAEQIAHVFHRDEEGVKIIATIPGPTKREQVVNAYVLSGIAKLLASGESKFDDRAARAVCESGGFFDGTNHMKYMKNSEFTGSKDKGWVLTTPGLEKGAALVSEASR